jgi:short subunit dehydrogenase-like uncharacterized protein
MIMMPYCWHWSSLQLTGQADFWHPAGVDHPRRRSGGWVGPFLMAGINTRVVRRSNALQGWA